MPPQTRRVTFPRIVMERDSETSESSEEEEEEEIRVNKNGGKAEEKIEEEPDSKKKGKASITISLKKVCKVCKRTGHEAGFKGATYIDCPMKPCFLCKMPVSVLSGLLVMVINDFLLLFVFGWVSGIKGHTTITCPHRVAAEHGAIPAPRRNSRSPLDYIFERQIRTKVPTGCLFGLC